MTYSGSCHCGHFRFEVDRTLGAVMDGDCSICRKAGFLHWIVEARQVRVLAGMKIFATTSGAPVWRGIISVGIAPWPACAGHGLSQRDTASMCDVWMASILRG